MKTGNASSQSWETFIPNPKARLLDQVREVIRFKANRIAAKAMPVRVEVDEELGSHFKVKYDNGQVAEVSWAFIRELPPKKK